MSNTTSSAREAPNAIDPNERWAKYRVTSNDIFANTSSTQSNDIFANPSSTQSNDIFANPSSTQSNDNFANPSSTTSSTTYSAQSSTPSDYKETTAATTPDNNNFNNKWAKYRVTSSTQSNDNTSSTQSNDNFANPSSTQSNESTGIIGILQGVKNFAQGTSKGLARAGASLLGSIASLGSADLEEDPEDKYLTEYARTGQAPERAHYNTASPTKGQHQKTIESVTAPEYFSKKTPGFGGTVESFLERGVPRAVENSLLTGGNPYVVAGGLLADAFREAGFEKTALGIDLLAPAGIKQAKDKAYALAKAVRPAGKIVPLKAALAPIEAGLSEASKLTNPDAYNFINTELRHLNKVLKAGKHTSSPRPTPLRSFRSAVAKAAGKADISQPAKATIEETIDAAKAINRSATKITTDPRFNKGEKKFLKEMLFKVSADLKESAYSVPGAEKFAVLNRAADQAAEAMFKNPGAIKRAAAFISKHSVYGGWAAAAHLIPGAAPIAAKAGLGSAAVLGSKDLLMRIFKSPVLRNQYLRAKSAIALGIPEVYDEEIQKLYDAYHASAQGGSDEDS